MNALGNKIITPTLIDPVDLKTILFNKQGFTPSYLSLPSDPNRYLDLLKIPKNTPLSI